MSTSQTPNYGLHQWAGEDQFKRTEFNEDNAKLDAALHGLRGDVDAKATQTALNALTTTVNGKAEQTALDALTARMNGKAEQSALNSLSAVVNGKGNCRIVTGSYTGTGGGGASNPNTLSFDGKPLFVVVTGGNLMLSLVRASETGISNDGVSSRATVSWGGTGVSWYGPNEFHQLNSPNTTYYYIALMAADG